MILNKWIKLLLIPLCLFTCAACHKETPMAKSSTLRISSENDPQTLDPRQARDLSTITVIRMLYEGLMRSEKNGDPTPAIAKSVEISPDQKTYTFTLRESVWSDGTPVTAQDFEETWKSALNPQFPSPNAYQLYPIQGAQAAKEGKISIDDIGVFSPNPKTLIVKLEQSAPYFLQLTTTHFYYPVHSSLRKQNINHPLKDDQIVANGPYQLEKWKHHNELSVVPNPLYWDKDKVQLDRIALMVLDNPTALQLFEKGELDWTGSPLSTLPTDALASLKSKSQLKVAPAAGTYLFRLNTETAPFQYPKMRQAFALALNRSDLVEHVLQGNQQPATGLVPPSFMQSKPLFKDNHQNLAKKLFQEALAEQNLTIENFPKVAICYASNERAHKIAQVAQQQWKECLGVNVILESSEAKVYYDRLKKQDYQIGVGSWFADFRDPISFLEIFKLKSNGTNNTQWENAHYADLLDQSNQQMQSQDREKILKSAERVLIKEMPIIPLFYSSYNYLTQPNVKGVYFSELGYLDFKNAYLSPTQ